MRYKSILTPPSPSLPPSPLFLSLPSSVPPTLLFSPSPFPRFHLSLLSRVPSPRCSSVAPLSLKSFLSPSPSLMARLKCHSTQGHPTHTAGGEGTIFSAICVSRTRRINCNAHTLARKQNAFVAHVPAKMGKLAGSPLPGDHTRPCWFLLNKSLADRKIPGCRINLPPR